MKVYETLRHTTWDCKYHVIFIPKCRRKVVYGQLRKELGTVFRALAQKKESEIIEGHLIPDHVHMLLSVPPKYCGGASGGIHERQKCDPHCAGVCGAEEELRRAALLGEAILGVDGRTRRGRCAPLHPRAGERRQVPRTTTVHGALSAAQ